MQGDWYNEIDDFVAAWLRNLIAAGMLPPGDVDTRSIVDVHADDLRGFRQCHFFAGVGGWPLALSLAGWDPDEEIWTGSCPCQPFSGAGKQRGTADERHLWPYFLRLIEKCRPAICIGEQVASKLGRSWLAGVRTDLEALGYGVGAADLCAASEGAPHIRQRLWWVASNERMADGDGRRQSQLAQRDSGPERGFEASHRDNAVGRSADGGMADADGGFARHGGLQPGGQHRQQSEDGGAGRLADSSIAGRSAQPQRPGAPEPGRLCYVDGLGDADDARSQRWIDGSGEVGGADQWPARPSGIAGHWRDSYTIACTDNKTRRVGAGVFPLAHGLSAGMVPSGDPSLSYVQGTGEARVGRLRGYGNAIVPQCGAEFVRAFLGCRP